MKSGNTFIKVALSSVFIFLTIVAIAQTTTWQGDVNNNWYDAGNWSNGVPDATKEAIMADVTPGGSNCIIATFTGGIAKKITIENGGRLTVSGPTFTVMSQENDAIHVEEGGELIIWGTLDIDTQNNLSERGLVIDGYCNVQGNININNITGLGVYVSLTGLVELNGGRLSVGNVEKIWSDGVENYGTINIDPSGRLNLNRITGHGIINHGVIISEGFMNIGVNGNTNDIAEKGIVNYNMFTSTGELNINETGLEGFRNEGTANFEGQFTISNTGHAGLMNSASPAFINLLNDIQLVISDTDLVGIENRTNGTVNYAPTSGSIHIDNTGNDGIKNFVGAVFNSGGPMYIGTTGTIGAKGIENNQGFTISDACSSFVHIGDGGLSDVSGGIVNNGTIIIEGSDVGTLGENNGYVVSKDGAEITIATDNGYYTTENQNVWKGCAGSDWEINENWTNASLPASNEIVVIPGNQDNNPFLNSSSSCDRLVVEEFASITISNIGDLSIVGNDLSLLNEGLVENLGTLNITKSTDFVNAFDNNNILINFGIINITNGNTGLLIEQGASFENKPGAEININNCFNAIEFFENSTNEGTIQISGGVIGFKTNNTDFTNEATATIQVEGISTIAFIADTDLGFTNDGIISLGMNSAMFGAAMDVIDGGFTNSATGIIRIGSGEFGIQVSRSSMINNGLIEIDGVVDEPIEVELDESFQNNKDIHIGFFTPPGKGILVDGVFSNGVGAALYVLTTDANGLIVNNDFINNEVFITNQGIQVNGNGNISGDGFFELEGDWNNSGTNDLALASLIFSGAIPSSVFNIQGTLEVNQIFGDKTNEVLTLYSDLQVNSLLTLSEGTMDLNGQIITLDENAELTGESNVNYIFDSEGTGAGFITHTKPLNAEFNVQPGNLGLKVGAFEDLGNFTVKRRHYNSVSGVDIINRTYEIFYENFGYVELEMTYLDHEIGNVSESTLGLFDVSGGTLQELILVNQDPDLNSLIYKGDNLHVELALAFSNRVVTWTGDDTGNWLSKGSWDLLDLPNVNYNVVIPEVNNPYPTIIPNITRGAKSITINENATLTNNGDLNILGSDAIGLLVNGDFRNLGNATLNIDDTNFSAIEIGENGLFDNQANIIQGATNSIGGDFITNNGSVTNSGIIRIEGQIADAPIFNNSTADLLNSGELTIGELPGTSFNSFRGIWNRGMLENDDTGVLNIFNYSNIALSNTSGGNVNNYGVVNIGQSSNSSIGLDGIDNNGDFQNYNTINIDNVGRAGITHDAGSFYNEGEINLGQNFNSQIGEEGILISDNFENLGVINLDNTASNGIELSSANATFINSGNIYIGNNNSISGIGLYVSSESDFQNLFGGVVDIKNSQNGLENYGTFNNEGELFFENTGQTGIFNNNNFTNSGLIGGEPRNIALNSVLGGTLSPGFSPGTITFEGSLEFDPGAHLIIEVDGTGFGEKDRVSVAEVVNLNNLALQVEVNYTPQDGDYIGFINASVITGAFSSVSLPPGWFLLTGPEVGIEYNSALPVDLVNFKAEERNGKVHLLWNTASEINNEGFEIFHSKNGKDWLQIGFTKGKGNSNLFNSYSFVHLDPNEGNNYYRLKQIDLDGQYEYSDIRNVQLKVEWDNYSLNVYPNPTSDFAYLDLPKDHVGGFVWIRNQNGRLIYENKIHVNQNRLSINFQDWFKGIYVIDVHIGDKENRFKLIHTGS